MGDAPSIADGAFDDVLDDGGFSGALCAERVGAALRRRHIRDTGSRVGRRHDLHLASRRVVGWAVGPTLETCLPLTALQRALAARQPAAGLTQHTDRGSQYASHDYRAVLQAHGIVQSMSRLGDYWDNAVAESFFATLEHELLATADFHSHRETERAIAEFIDDWYNPTRRHSAFGYASAMQYERQLGQAARAA